MKRLILIFSLFLTATGTNAQDDSTCFKQFMKCMSFCLSNDDPQVRGNYYQVCGQIHYGCTSDKDGRTPKSISVFPENASMKNQEFIQFINDEVLTYKSTATQTFDLGCKLELITPPAGMRSVLGIAETHSGHQILRLNIYDSDNQIVKSDEVHIPQGKSAIYIEYFDLALGNYRMELSSPDKKGRGAMDIVIE